MNDLVTRSIEEGNVSFLAEFPDELLDEDEKEVIGFVLKYTRRFEKVPSIKKLMKKFDWFVPFIFEPSEWEPEPQPLGDLFEEVVKEKLLKVSTKLLRDVRTVMREEGIVPLDILSEIDKIHIMSLGVSRYSSFDRDLYFRRKAMNIPFKIINNHIGGLCNGDFLLLIGRLGTGKSTFAQFIAKEKWLDGKRILFISAEMLGLDVFSRIDAMVGGFNPLDLRKERTVELDSTLKLVERTVSRKRGEIIVPKTRILSPDQIAAFAKNLEIDLIMVDGCYLLKPSNGSYGSKWEKVAAVSNELKQIALELDVPIIGTAQIKRGASGAEGYDPEDIAFSDALGQDADFVVAIYPNPIMPERAELQLIKNRYGSTCATQVTTDFEKMEIKDDSVAVPEKISFEEWGKSK